jgi:hypothetical protein
LPGRARSEDVYLYVFPDETNRDRWLKEGRQRTAHARRPATVTRGCAASS